MATSTKVFPKWIPRPAFITVITLALISSFFVSVDSIEFDFNYTKSELTALEKFKRQIEDTNLIPEDSMVKQYAKDDYYLMRWLRARNLNVKAAVKMLKEHLDWREEEKMDTIDQEDFSDIIDDLPMFEDGTGKNGEPIMEWWYSDFQIRTIVISGRMRRALRLLSKNFEMTCRRFHLDRAEGKNITGGIAIVDMAQFDPARHGCPSCLAVYVAFVKLLESHYTLMLKEVFMLSIPPPAFIVWRVAAPVLSRGTRSAVSLISDPAKWMPELDKRIDRDQRGIPLGGTMTRGRE